MAYLGPLSPVQPQSFPEAARALADVSRRLDARGWVLGTSGNFSAVVRREPLRMAITPSATLKSELGPDQIVEIDGWGSAQGGAGRPSAEALVHIEIVRARHAGAVLHTHSVWSTVLSDVQAADGGVSIEGYEMLKGLEGVRSHDHREWVPIIENDQDMARLARAVGDLLARHPGAHALLIRRHGLYTWGADLVQALRHVEILEFLVQTVGETMAVRQVSERAALET
jgi:methylthioribulose-1-phosphate dehydratase